MNIQNFDELIGKSFTLFKSNLLNHFQLDNVLYEVLEDESDGYRSAMKYVAIVDDDQPSYYHEELGQIVVEKAPENYSSYSGKIDENNWYKFEGYQLRSIEDNHIWLVFGTDNFDDYYPSFTYNWTPKGV